MRKYAAAYSTILTKQPRFAHYYIDGFAGAGFHVSKATGETVLGSPLNALTVEPPFKHYFLIDLSGNRVESLRRLIGDRSDVTLLQGDCNRLLLQRVFPLVQYSQRRRALCLLDPYGLHLDWRVIAKAGELRTIDLFLNFPMMDINRNALWSQPHRVSPTRAARLTALWGDESWRDIAYRPSPQGSLFGDTEVEKASNEAVARAFRQRLQDAAGFGNVPMPMPMRNRANAVVYYLFFASQHEVAAKIAASVFRRHSRRGVV